MKFKFRLESILKLRKREQDSAQNEYQSAQEMVRRQLSHIEDLYQKSDNARAMAGSLAQQGGACANELVEIDLFIEGQKLIIQNER